MKTDHGGWVVKYHYPIGKGNNKVNDGWNLMCMHERDSISLGVEMVPDGYLKFYERKEP